MDLNFSSLPTLQTQSGAKSGSNSIPGGDSAVKTLQINPDSVVSQSGRSAKSKSDSESGLARQQQPELQSAQQVLDSLRFSSRRTQVGFNSELNKVFLEIVDTRTDKVIEQIPSKELVKFVSERLEPPAERAQSRPNGAVIDEAV